MKTTTTTKFKITKGLTNTITGLLLITFLSIGLNSSVSAQDKFKIGTSYSKWVTGSGSHLTELPSLALQYNEYGFSVSPNLAQSNKQLSGFNYDFKFFPKLELDARLDVFLHYTGILNFSIKSSYNSEMIYQRVPKDVIMNNEIQGFEHYAGFGIGKSLTKKFGIQSSIGIGYFKMNINENIRFTTPSIILKATVVYL